MKKMVLIEIKHCIDRAEYKVVFIALMILNIASYILCVKNDIGKSYQFIRSANENFVLQGTEAAYIPYIMYLLLPVYATIIASLSLIREEKSNSSILLIQRIGKKKYLAGKLFGILIVTFLTITIPMLRRAAMATMPPMVRSRTLRAHVRVTIRSAASRACIPRLRVTFRVRIR